MCLILLAFKHHRKYPLIIAANRDEFFDRPTEPACFWKDVPEILAGRDLREGGTWMGIHRTGRLAALTNYRDPRLLRQEAPSRGNLVRSFLEGTEDPLSYLDSIRQRAAAYNGFSLLVGNMEALYCYSNRGAAKSAVSPGIHGLSNHLMDTPWPKVQRGKELLAELLSGSSEPCPEAILDILGNEDHPPDNLLPDTGVGLEWERMLSPLFISSPFYGTCSSTALLVSREREVLFVERDTRPGPGKGSVKQFEFTVDPSGRGWKENHV